jgi:hypothetical protein
MSKRARALILGATLAAMNLAAMTAVAQAHTSNDLASTRHRALGQLEFLATTDHAVGSQEQPTADATVRRPPTQGQVGEAWHQPQVPAEEPTVAGDTRRPPTESQVGESWRHPTGTPVRSAEPSGRSGWLVALLSVLAVALALAGGLAVLAARRAGRRARLGHAA